MEALRRRYRQTVEAALMNREPWHKTCLQLTVVTQQ